MPRRPLARFVLPLALSCAAVPLSAQAPTPAVVEETGECTLGEPVMQVLRDEHGRPFFVEPESLVPGTDGELLLLGTPTYVWEEVDSTFREVARNEHTGALIRGGTGALLPVPDGVEAPVGFRGVQLRPGRWGAVFASDSVGRYAQGRMWFAETDGRGWGAPVEVPLPEGLPVLSSYTSDLVRTTAGVGVAAVQEGPGMHRPAVRLEGDADGFRGEPLDDGWVGTVAVLGHRHEAPIVVVAGPGSRTGRLRELRVVEREGRWGVRQRTTVPAMNTFGRHISFAAGSEGFVTWAAPLEQGGMPHVGTARLAGTPPRIDEVLLLGRTMAAWAAFAHGDRPVWVLLQPTENNLLGELKVLVGHEERIVLAGRFPSPFLGPFAGASLGDDRIVLIGPRFQDHPTYQAVLGLRVDVSLACR